MTTASQVQKNLQAAMRDALRIQDRFVAEPLFARTGRGYLKSEGVATLQFGLRKFQNDRHDLTSHESAQVLVVLQVSHNGSNECTYSCAALFSLQYLLDQIDGDQTHSGFLLFHFDNQDPANDIHLPDHKSDNRVDD